MDRITLDKANKISDSIRCIESEIDGWQRSIGFAEKPLCAAGKEGREYVRVGIKHLDFLLIKEMAIAELQRRLEKLQQEFNYL